MERELSVVGDLYLKAGPGYPIPSPENLEVEPWQETERLRG